ncbi:MAG: hypothetical protein VB135_01580 [Burkholderia sp.]
MIEHCGQDKAKRAFLYGQRDAVQVYFPQDRRLNTEVIVAEAEVIIGSSPLNTGVFGFDFGPLGASVLLIQ